MRFLISLVLFFSIASGQSLEEAARELARKIHVAIPSGTAIALTTRTLATNQAEARRLRPIMEKSLRGLGARFENPAGAEVAVTISENAAGPLLAVEIRRGEETTAVFARYRRDTERAAEPPAMTIERRLLLRQPEQILDAASAGEVLLVLEPDRVVIHRRGAARQALAIPAILPRPRDLRGQLLLNGAGFTAHVPGLKCAGTTDGGPLACEPGDHEWPLGNGARATFVPNRNYFDGALVLDAAPSRKVEPFYSAVAGPQWILTGLDGQARIYNRDWEPLGTVSGTGSEIAGIEGRCGSYVLTTRNETFIQALESIDGRLDPAAAPLDLAAPVTALSSAAVAITHDRTAGVYAAYQLTLACSR